MDDSKKKVGIIKRSLNLDLDLNNLQKKQSFLYKILCLKYKKN